MLIAVSALDVAFVSSIAALVGAIVGPLVTWVITGTRNRQERWLKRYDDRRNAYYFLLEESYLVRDWVLQWLEDVRAGRPERNINQPRTEEERSAAIAHAVAHASEEVIDAQERLIDAQSATLERMLRSEREELESVRKDPAARNALADEVEVLLGSYRGALQELRTAIRDELAE